MLGEEPRTIKGSRCRLLDTLRVGQKLLLSTCRRVDGCKCLANVVRAEGKAITTAANDRRWLARPPPCSARPGSEVAWQGASSLLHIPGVIRLETSGAGNLIHALLTIHAAL